MGTSFTTALSPPADVFSQKLFLLFLMALLLPLMQYVHFVSPLPHWARRAQGKDHGYTTWYSGPGLA